MRAGNGKPTGPAVEQTAGDLRKTASPPTESNDDANKTFSGGWDVALLDDVTRGPDVWG